MKEGNKHAVQHPHILLLQDEGSLETAESVPAVEAQCGPLLASWAPAGH